MEKKRQKPELDNLVLEVLVEEDGHLELQQQKLSESLGPESSVAGNPPGLLLRLFTAGNAPRLPVHHSLFLAAKRKDFRRSRRTTFKKRSSNTSFKKTSSKTSFKKTSRKKDSKKPAARQASTPALDLHLGHKHEALKKRDFRVRKISGVRKTEEQPHGKHLPLHHPLPPQCSLPRPHCTLFCSGDEKRREEKRRVAQSLKKKKSWSIIEEE